MTSFAYPQTMAALPFDPYSAEPYSEFVPTSESYPATSYPDTSYTAAFSANDSYQSANGYSDLPRSHDSFRYHIDSSGAAVSNAPIAYSPAPSPGLYPPRLSASSESGASVHSTSSSALTSPNLHPQYHSDVWNPVHPGSNVPPQDAYFSTGVEQESILAANKLPGYVDPSILNPFPSPIHFNTYPDISNVTSPHLFEPQPASPALSHSSTNGKVKKSPVPSPYLHTQQYHPYHHPAQRRQSTSSVHSRNSQSTHGSGSFELDDADRERGLCPIPDCGRVFKDLKAHMLTHQPERPEKCPIQTCEYHTKGFARKYDKNRHTLTHYKGTMVCGFCPGSGSAAEKSFNRADVFKRHLTSVHGVEQAPPNSRRKSPTAKKPFLGSATTEASGMCSTCSINFSSAQDFYEHLDDCVLRVVQQIDPAEAINQKHLTAIAEDKNLQDTMDKHHLPSSMEDSVLSYDDEEEDEEEEPIDVDDANDTTYGSRNSRSGKGTIRGKKNQS